ncbi:MAG: hypothetical protein ACYDGM_12480 [Vulcanimicrobiaceae bacterium]
MIVQPQIDPTPTAFTGGVDSDTGESAASSFLGMPAGMGQSADAIARLMPPQQTGPYGNGVFGQTFGQSGGLWGAIEGLIQQLGTMLSQFMSGNAGSNGLPSEQYFGSANGASVGDPHLSFNGTTWDNMGNQPDLLHSDSFAGGFSLSTQTTPPNAQGVAWNQRATISTNYGATSVSLDNSGTASVIENGMPVQLQSGTPLDLGNGDTVTLGTDGSVQMTANNGLGGNITTTLRTNGNGVDVTCSASNVDLGGTLANGPFGAMQQAGNNGLPGLWMRHPRPIEPIAFQHDDPNV